MVKIQKTIVVVVTANMLFEKFIPLNTQINGKSVTELEKLFHRIQEYIKLSPTLSPCITQKYVETY